MSTVMLKDAVIDNADPKGMFTGEVMLKVPPKFIQSPRIQKLAQRSRELAISGKRRLGTAEEPLGDHACWIDIGPFPTWIKCRPK